MNKRLLVLESQPELVQVFQSGLTSFTQGNVALASEPAHGFEVLYVSDPKLAVAAVEKAAKESIPFAGVFLDLNFAKGEESLETIESIHQADPDALILIVAEHTSGIWETINGRFGEQFADHWDFLVKPLQPGQLLQKASRTVASWQRRKQLQANEAQLISSERLATIGTLARGIGHDFGNLIQTLMMKAEMALQKKTPQAMEEALQYLLANGERASAVVRNLQSLVKTEATRELVCLEVPIKEATQLIEFEMKKSKVKLVLDFDQKPLASVRINKFEVNQVFLNLMINSVHAMEQKGGELKVKATTDDAGVAIAISDSGCGIPAENLKKIWEPLFTTKAGKGSGIGLSVTKKIIENHGGKISLASEVGKGTTFTIWLPK